MGKARAGTPHHSTGGGGRMTQDAMRELWAASIPPEQRASINQQKQRPPGKCLDCSKPCNAGAKRCGPCGVAANREQALGTRKRPGGGRSKWDRMG